MKKHYKSIISFVFISLGIAYYIKNLGNYFDITRPPIKSDVILCLGGETEYRVFKAFELFKLGYSTKNKIIITDKYASMVSSKIDFLKANGLIEETNIINNSKTQNTYEELMFMKKYMLKNNYKSLIILSSPAHSKRINMLIENFIKFSDSNITFIIVGDNVEWWNKSEYYKNRKAVSFVSQEFFKIIYNYIFYMLDSFIEFDEETISNLIKLKTSIYKYFKFY